MNAPADRSRGGGSGGRGAAGRGRRPLGGREAQTGPCCCRSLLTLQREPGQGQAPPRVGGSGAETGHPPSQQGVAWAGDPTPFLVQTLLRADPLPRAHMCVPQASGPCVSDVRSSLAPCWALSLSRTSWPGRLARLRPGTHGPPLWSWGRVTGALALPRSASKPQPALVLGCEGARPSPGRVEGAMCSSPSAPGPQGAERTQAPRRPVTPRPALVAR